MSTTLPYMKRLASLALSAVLALLATKSLVLKGEKKAYKALSSLLVVEAVVVVKLRCPYCGYVWDYKGKKSRYATCPNCLRKVDIQKNRVE
jgi:rubrerythrin